jgi:hypothetical protein
MAQLDDEHRYAREFLLGYPDEVARQTVEERLMTDPDYLALVLQVENDLMEDYIAHQLSEDDRSRFDKYVLGSKRQIEQLNLTRALTALAKVDAAAHSPPMVTRNKDVVVESVPANLLHAKIWGVNAVLAAVLLFIMVGIAAMIVLRSASSRNDSLQGSVAEEVAKLNAQQDLDSEAISHGIVIGPLKHGLSRDDVNSNKFVIPTTERIVQLRLQIGTGQYQAFQAELQTVEGREIVTLSDLKERRINGERLVIIFLPAKVLSPADYQLRLTGVSQNNQVEYLGRYTFRIVGN